jgi:hypothetical protein
VLSGVDWFDDHIEIENGIVSSIFINDIEMLLLSEYVKFVSMLFSFINVSNMCTICVSMDFGERDSDSVSYCALGECVQCINIYV